MNGRHIPVGLRATALRRGRMALAPDIVRLFTAVDARTAAWCAALGAVIVVLIGLPLSAALNVWMDEAFTLHTTGAGLAAAWAQAVRFEDQPPLYFVIEAAWRLWDESSITFARIPSVLFAAAAVAVTVLGANRIAPRTPPLVVALIAAFHPVVIWAAVEMRVYALVLLIGAVLTWTFFEGFLVSEPSRRARAWYVAFALAGLYTQYFVGFVVAAHFLTLLALRRRSSLAFLGLMPIVGVGFLPFVRVALAQVRTPGDSLLHATLAGAAHQILNIGFVYALPHDLAWSGGVKLAGFGLAAALLAALAIGGRLELPAVPQRAIVMQVGFAMALFSIIFAAVGVPFDLVRHLIVLVPSILLFVALLLSSVRRMRLLACGLTVAVFAIFAANNFWLQYHPPLAKLGDWQRVAATLAADDRTIPVATFPAELALPLQVYLPVPAIPIPRRMPFVLDYVAMTRLTGDADVARVLDPVRARSQHLWLVTGNECRPTDFVLYDYHCGILEAYLRRHYRLEKTALFHGTVARRYVRAATLTTAART